MNDLDLRWNRTDWLEEARTWVDARLADLGIERDGELEQVHAYPWATVLRVPTASEPLFFKAMVPQLAHEAGALRILAAIDPDLLTELVVADADTGWMLMRDAGAPIRTHAEEPYGDWERIVARYADLQIRAAHGVDDLLSAGVPDRRTPTLVPLLADVLEDDAAVWKGRELGLTEEERARLRDDALPRLADLCADLSALPIADTIQHDDLHANNVFVREGHWRILDWGDACVAHPFASLVVPIRSLAHRRNVEENAPELVRIRDAYLEPWTRLAPRAELLRALEVAWLIGYATRLLSWQHIVPHFDPPVREEYSESVPRWFRMLLEKI